MAQLAGSIRQPREHRVAVRDGLIARRLHAAGNGLSWKYRFFFHAQILPRRLPRPRIGAEPPASKAVALAPHLPPKPFHLRQHRSSRPERADASPQDLGLLFSATSNACHPDWSRLAHLLFCFAPAKQPACEVEGSLFAFHRYQNTI